MLEHEALSRSVLGAAIETHRHLGPGLLESAYEACLCHELMLRGHRVERQVPIRLLYKGVELDCGFRIDILVDGVLVVELKSVEKLSPIHEAQLISYLKLSERTVGLLINFNVLNLRDGVVRRAMAPNRSHGAASAVLRRSPPSPR